MKIKVGAYQLNVGDVIIGTSEINNACYEVERPDPPKGFVTTGGVDSSQTGFPVLCRLRIN